jgi:threonine dehydratase
MLRQIQEARSRIRESVRLTPCPHSVAISAMTGNHVYLKLENLQMTGSFKERGALNRILTLNSEERQRGVIAASAGNHAQAVAYHATRHGIRSQIVMPLATPLVKAAATRNFGGEVILHGANFDEAMAEARRRCTAEDLYFLHAFDDEAVIAGQGTIGLELLEQVPHLEAVVCPIGGGGLIGGIACAVKSLNPSVRIIGVEAERVPSMKRAVELHTPITVDPAVTIADGIAVRRAGNLTLPLVEHYVDDIVTVTEDEIASAILILLEREKTLAEGAGAAGVAAMLQRRTGLQNQKTAVLVCGGNIDVTLLSRIIERGLVADGRQVRMRIHLMDRPGGLQELTRLIAGMRANVVQLLHDRAYYGVNLGDTVVDITLETRGPEHIAELERQLDDAGYRHQRVL